MLNSHENHFDVVIIGAGLSGIGAARQLQSKCPGKSFVLLEARNTLGGTWDLFKYPGIRSDSDMFTMGFETKPWHGDTNVVSKGPLILSYLKEAATETNIVSHIRYNFKVATASWSSTDACWQVESERDSVSGTTKRITGNILYVCSGYYNYKSGYTPKFEGIENFQGTVIHPQHWPEGFQYDDKRVVVIGSGATAMTIVPAMAKSAAHVTMLQRTPTYVISWPEGDAVAKAIKALLPTSLSHKLIRTKNIYTQQLIYKLARKYPNAVKKILLKLASRHLPAGYEVEKHFTPTYKPWDQRLCLVPNADIFKSIAKGKVSVATDEIKYVKENGIELKSGEFLPADIIVTATGLELLALGGVQFTIDGKAIELSDTFSYKGMMFSGVPNLINSFGYINASWTLRSELVADWVCRLINHMNQNGQSICTPHLRDQDKEMSSQYMIDNFSSGYVGRGIHQFARQGDRYPWRSTQNYLLDREQIQTEPIADDVLHFTERPVSRHHTYKNDAQKSEHLHI